MSYWLQIADCLSSSCRVAEAQMIVFKYHEQHESIGILKRNHWKRTSDLIDAFEVADFAFPPLSNGMSQPGFTLLSPQYHVYLFLPRLPYCHVPNVVVISLATPWNNTESFLPNSGWQDQLFAAVFNKNWEPLTPRCGDSPLCLNQGRSLNDFRYSGWMITRLGKSQLRGWTGNDLQVRS